MARKSKRRRQQPATIIFLLFLLLHSRVLPAVQPGSAEGEERSLHPKEGGTPVLLLSSRCQRARSCREGEVPSLTLLLSLPPPQLRGSPLCGERWRRKEREEAFFFPAAMHHQPPLPPPAFSFSSSSFSPTSCSSVLHFFLLLLLFQDSVSCCNSNSYTESVGKEGRGVSLLLFSSSPASPLQAQLGRLPQVSSLLLSPSTCVRALTV